MANILLTPSVITKEALVILHQKLNFVGNTIRDYDDRYAKSGAKIGNDLQIRLPNEFTVRTGAALNAQDVTESSVTLTVATQKGVDLNFTSEERTMHIDEFSDRYIEPAMSVLAAAIEWDMISNVYKDVYNFVDGVDGAVTFAQVVSSGKVLTDNLAPLSKRCMLHNTTSSADIVVANSGLFQDSKEISRQYKEGMLGRIAGFDHFESTLVPDHTTGSAVETDTSYNVNGATEDGASVTVDGGSTTFLKGDIVTFAGCNRVHPETKADTGVLQNFVITADSGASATSLAISPSIVTSGGRQNVSGYPTDDGAVSKIGEGANGTHKQTLAFHKDAFAFGTADLVMPEGVDFAAREVMDGISMRIVRQYDITNDKFPCRMDVLYGYKTVRAQLAARLGNN